MNQATPGAPGAAPTMWSHLIGLPFTQGYVHAGGVRTRYLRAGPQGAPTLLLLHGTTGHVETYARNIAAHAQEFDVLAIDMLGHGFTAKPDVPHEVADYVKHVVAVLDALGLQRVHVSGQSLGGWVAGRLAIDHPERLGRLCLNTAGGAHSDPRAMGAILEKTLAAVTNPTHQAVRQRLEFLMHDPASVSDELVATRQAIYRIPGMVEATRRILCLQDPVIRDRNLIPDAQWRRIAAPTLVVWTTHDPTAPVEVGRRIASLVPDSRFELMENCAHWPQWENPEHFNRIHLAFLRGDA
jgi:2-hydroxy-6-oxonona-2,4-dienedioate hydrolase